MCLSIVLLLLFIHVVLQESLDMILSDEEEEIEEDIEKKEASES